MDTITIESKIPDSVLPYPKELRNRVKYAFWRGVYPVHNGVRDFMLSTHLVRHKGRQNYLLGKIAPGRDPEAFLKFLESKGFGNHFIAWNDDDQIASLRKADSFEYQYHIRIFKDGEVRGHYEPTPEFSPIAHLAGYRQTARRKEFANFLEDWVVTTEK